MKRWVVGAGLALALGAPVAAQEMGDRVVINGYTNFEFEKQISKQGNGDKNGAFDADQIDLVFNITVSERVRVSIDLSWEHGTATEVPRGNQALEYGFVEYALSDKLKLRFGKMHTPFGVFNEIHTAKPAFLSVKEAPSLNKNSRLVGGGYLFYPRWGAGIAAHGDAVVHGMDLTYDVLVANGDSDTVNPFEKDENSAKALTARARLDVTDKLRVGYSFYRDRLSSASFTTIQSHGFEAELTLARFRILGEIAVGSLGRVSGGAQKQIGWYVQPSFHLSHGITPYIRLDNFNPDRQIAGLDGRDFLVGVNLELAKNFQLKLENNDFRGGPQSTLAKFPGRGYNEFKAALVLGF
jgi:opacity protein-like surface antigen